MSDFNSTLGLTLSEDQTSVLLETKPEHEVGPGFIHFAVLATVAEVAAAQAVQDPVVPTNIQLHLLSAAKPGILVGKGKILRKGKRLVIAEGEVFQAETLVAKATVTFSVR